MDKSFYSSINYFNSFNKPLVIVNGGRGTGKTHGFLVQAIQNFYKKGEQFVYLRRTEEEFKKVKNNIFENINNMEIFPDEVKFFSGRFWIEEKVCGYAMAISCMEGYKGGSYGKVSTLCFDEYISHAKNAYNKNEPFKFFEFLETIFRERKMRVYMFSNNLKSITPYTFAWGLFTEKGNYKIGENFVFIELENKRISEHKKKSCVGALAYELCPDYITYAYENRALDGGTMIKKKTGKCVPFFNILGENLYIIWYGGGDYYVEYCTKKEEKTPILFTLESRFSSKSVPLYGKNNQFVQDLLKACFSNALFFKDEKIKSEFFSSFSNIMKGVF